MNKTSTIIILLLLIIIAMMGWMLWTNTAEAPSASTVSTSSPTGQVSNTEQPSSGTTTSTPRPLHERVVVTSPKPNTSVSKKFTVTGKAPGNWFFEASAPIMVQTPDGDKVGQSYVQAEGDWMTTELVDFKGEITVNAAYSGPATLILMKDNPSGLPEHDDSLEIPIEVQ